MKPTGRRLAWAALIVSALLVPPARADDDCEAPVQQWQSRDAVLQMAARNGWQVRHLKIDDGCYEIRGRDAEGRAFKAKVDPRTLSVVRMRRGGDHGDGARERERERDREADRSRPHTADRDAGRQPDPDPDRDTPRRAD